MNPRNGPPGSEVAAPSRETATLITTSTPPGLMAAILTPPLLPYAVEYAAYGWPVFPLRGKVPLAGSRGVLDASTDVAVVARWWTHRPYANIGGRIPSVMMMIDIDPRAGGLESLAALIAHHGPLPPTLTDLSGRCDGGVHFWFARPPGRLSAKRLGPGIDLKTDTGYAVLPPSIHPDTGRPYVRIERPVAAPPEWLMKLLAPTLPPSVTPEQFIDLLVALGYSIAWVLRTNLLNEAGFDPQTLQDAYRDSSSYGHHLANTRSLLNGGPYAAGPALPLT